MQLKEAILCITLGLYFYSEALRKEFWMIYSSKNCLFLAFMQCLCLKHFVLTPAPFAGGQTYDQNTQWWLSATPFFCQLQRLYKQIFALQFHIQNFYSFIIQNSQQNKDFPCDIPKYG